jgi:AbiJ N-terminal domain 4
MAIVDIFSKRNQRVPATDLLVYDSLPKKLKIQILHIWGSTLGLGGKPRYSGTTAGSAIWSAIVETLEREFGVMRLADGKTNAERASNFLLEPRTNTSQAIDLIEMTFAVIDGRLWPNLWQPQNPALGCQTPDDAIAELNHRFLENGVGYQYTSGKIVRLDNTYQHSQVVLPALTLLTNPKFSNAQAEFLRAHEAYRQGRYSDSLNESLKAFESTMKIICSEKGWTFNATDTASKLIRTILDNGLISSSYEQQLSSLRTLLESGTPTVRNKNSGHGQGTVQVVIPDFLALYGLNTAAANIVLLVSAFEATR